MDEIHHKPLDFLIFKAIIPKLFTVSQLASSKRFHDVCDPSWASVDVVGRQNPQRGRRRAIRGLRPVAVAAQASEAAMKAGHGDSEKRLAGKAARKRDTHKKRKSIN